MDRWFRALRQGGRSLSRTPRLTIAALASTALGIGSAVFMLTLIDVVLLRRPPFPAADRLVRIWTVSAETGEHADLSYLDFRDLGRQAKSFEALEMAARTRLAVETGDGTERMRGESVTPGYFALIGLEPALGRFFTPEEHAPDGDRAIVLSDAMWKRKYGGRPDILGQVVRARSTHQGRESVELHTVVGVMPPGFVGTVDPDVSDFWLPAEHFTPRSVYERREARNVWPLARLKPGVHIAAAQAEVDRIGRRLAAEFPQAYDGIGLAAEPFGESWREPLRAGLLMLAGAAGLLLLIACTNVANLLLARLARREHELTLRMVLGARRGRLLGELLAESLLLAAAGGGAGALLAGWGIEAFAAAGVVRLPTYVTIAPDPRVVVLTVALVLATGILFGVLPAWFGTRVDASRNLREASRGSGLGRRQRRHGELLVVLEVGFTFVLLTGAVLMLRSYRNLAESDLGYRTENLLRMAVSLDPTDYPDARSQLAFVREAKVSLGAFPGVRRVAFLAGVLPPWFDDIFDVVVEGTADDALKEVGRHAVDTDFLEVLGMTLRQGRNFGPADTAEAPPVAIASESLARYVAGGDGKAAVGRTVRLVTDPEARELSPPIEIVGVVADVRYHGPLAERKIDYDLYVPIEQAPQSVMSIAIHTGVDPASLIPPLQRELGRLAPTSPQHWISTMEEELALKYTDARFYAWLTGIYSACAVLLAVLGLYGVLAHSVSRRFGELGTRMAVGAGTGDILRLVLGQGFRTLVLGLGVGAALSLLGTRLAASLLYGVTATDPATFGLVAAGLLLLGLAACYLPAKRATRVDPVIVLRGE